VARNPLRSARFDDLGLRRALGEGMLPLLVAAMAFLAALAMGGVVGARVLAARWQGGAASALTVQVPQPGAALDGQNRLDRALGVLHATPGVAAVRALTEGELADLLRPWLGSGAERLSIPLPAVIAVRLAPGAAPPEQLAARLAAAVPGTLTESHDVWLRRLALLSGSLQGCAWLALAMVAGIATAVVAIATRAGLAARREAIEIVHGLGATDGYIAGCFARRATGLATMGGLLGAVAALPVLLALAWLAAPFAGARPWTPDGAGWLGLLGALPAPLWLGLPALPLAAAAIGFLTAQATVRRWLRRLP
jgi:cell division transport system permease protein